MDFLRKQINDMMNNKDFLEFLRTKTNLLDDVIGTIRQAYKIDLAVAETVEKMKKDNTRAIVLCDDTEELLNNDNLIIALLEDSDYHSEIIETLGSSVVKNVMSRKCKGCKKMKEHDLNPTKYIIVFDNDGLSSIIDSNFTDLLKDITDSSETLAELIAKLTYSMAVQNFRIDWKDYLNGRKEKKESCNKEI